MRPFQGKGYFRCDSPRYQMVLEKVHGYEYVQAIHIFFINGQNFCIVDICIVGGFIFKPNLNNFILIQKWSGYSSEYFPFFPQLH